MVDGEHLLIADNPEQFADKIVSLLTDHQLYKQISANGRQLVETHYDWDNIAGRLMDVYAGVLAQPYLPKQAVPADKFAMALRPADVIYISALTL